MKLPIYSISTPQPRRGGPACCRERMQFLTSTNLGNPASRSTIAFGWQAEEAVDIARNQIAELVGADPRENRLYLRGRSP